MNTSKNTSTTKITIKKNKNNKGRNRYKRRDVSIANTKRILCGQGNQIYGFGRNVFILSDTVLLAANTFYRISLNQLFSLSEFQTRKDYFKYFKVNHVMVLLYPNASAGGELLTLMFEWRNPILVEDEILKNDSARTVPIYATKNRVFTWRPPNTVIDNNFVMYMNKPQEIGYWSEYPGWLYLRTSTSGACRINFAMNITLISNNLKIDETLDNKQKKEEMKEDKYKIIEFPCKKEKEMEFIKEEEKLEDWNEEEELSEAKEEEKEKEKDKEEINNKDNKDKIIKKKNKKKN